MPPVKPLVFLDIDGVLNNPGIWGKRPLETEAIDPPLVALLDGLVEQVDAEIIISSSWRYQFTVEDFRIILAAKGLTTPARIVNTTPKFFGDQMCRGEEIKRFLLIHYGRNLDAPPFVIFDDMGLDQFPNWGTKLIHVNGAVGLTPGDVTMALHLLTRQGWVRG